MTAAERIDPQPLEAAAAVEFTRREGGFACVY